MALSPSFAYYLGALDGCGSWFVEHVFINSQFVETSLWLLDCVVEEFWFVFLVVVILFLCS